MKKRRNNKLILVIVWALFLSLHTWTSQLSQLLLFQSVSFHWNPYPDFKELLYLTDISEIHHYFILVKTGHFLGFAIFDFLLFRLLQSHKKALVISFAFALFTEILQLYFYRDGRLYDFAIDSCGAVMVYFLLKSKEGKKILSKIARFKIERSSH